MPYVFDTALLHSGFARSDALQPAPISPANGLTLDEEVPLQGSITLDLKYL